MPDDDLTPEEEQVRRMLADARHTEPIPPDVADRLDEVLAGLQAGHVDDPVVRPLRTPPSAAEAAAAHRRQRVRTWLVAAAAVVVVGVGVNQIDWAGMGMSSDSEDSASTSEVAGEAADEDAGEAPAGAAARELAQWKMARLQLTADNFGDRVTRFRDGVHVTSGTLQDFQSYLAESDASSNYSPVCDVGDLGPGHLVPVRYDGERAWLVFRKPEGDSQVVDLYLCGQQEPTRSITLPAP